MEGPTEAFWINQSQVPDKSVQWWTFCLQGAHLCTHSCAWAWVKTHTPTMTQSGMQGKGLRIRIRKPVFFFLLLLSCSVLQINPLQVLVNCLLLLQLPFLSYPNLTLILGSWPLMTILEVSLHFWLPFGFGKLWVHAGTWRERSNELGFSCELTLGWLCSSIKGHNYFQVDCP